MWRTGSDGVRLGILQYLKEEDILHAAAICSLSYVLFSQYVTMAFGSLVKDNTNNMPVRPPFSPAML